MQFVTHINPSLMESQSGHHPGHHGHSAYHSSTLPHQIHQGGGNPHHQINLDTSHPHQHQHHQSSKHHPDTHHTAHQSSHRDAGHHHHHHHHHHSDGNTSFLRAARAGNLEKVLEHLKNNIDINTCNANGLNALHLASKDGHISVVSELLSRGALVDAATKKGNTALHIASLAGQEEVVKLLIQHNASVNVQSQNGFTPLYMAAQENHDSVVKLLLSNGANQSLATEDGFTPLAVAMQQGHDKVVAVLLESDTRGKVRLPALHIAAKKDDVKAATLLLENDHNPDVTSKSGFTPLHISAHYGNEAIANLLIQKGADVNYAAKHNITPLHVAAKWGKTNMVALLLEKGANIESKTRDGLTPLHCAARSGHEQVVDMLLERGAPISSKTKNGLAPLHMAAQGEHVDAARILLYHRAPVDEVTVDYLTALHVAAHCGHVRVAKLLLDRNADANARALNGFTPLHIACKKNRIKVVELLLKHGASIGATTESGLTPLHVASFMGCMNIVIYLMQHDASPDVPTVRGETPLHLAARANQTDIIRILLRNGAQVDARAREQQTPLHIASRLGNVDIVMLLLQHGAQVDAVTKDMYTALHIAAKEGQDEVAAVLLDNGAQIDATTKKGFTPLHLTAKYGNIKVAQLLLSKDAPVDAQGKNGVTPLHVASHYDHQNVALLLLEKGASSHATAKNGHTPLHIAARKNQMDIATTLLEYGAQANAESKAGFTPLHLSSQEGHTDMSSLLLEHKADADHQAKNGLTPLHLCAQEDKVQVAQILVKHGANIEAPTKAGYTPLHVASHFGQTNMVRYLIEQGANFNTATSIGYTPLHQAAQQGHLHIVQVLVENNADPNVTTTTGQTPLHIAQKLGYISVFDSLKPVTNSEVAMSTSMTEEKYRVVAPEAMHETFMSDSEEEGDANELVLGTSIGFNLDQQSNGSHIYLPYFNGDNMIREDTALSDQPYRYLTVDEMKSLGDDSLPIDVTRDERLDNKMIQSSESAKPPQALEDSISPQHVSVVHNEVRTMNDSTDYAATADNIVIDRHPQHVGFLVSFLVDARGGAMRGCRHSGVRVIVPARSAAQPTRITCRYVKPQRTMHPPPLMEGEALASRVLELGPVGAKFLGPVIMEVPHFASLRGKEREIVILRSDNGETWREHTIENSDEIISEVLSDCFDPEDIAQMDEISGGRICRFVTYDFPQYFAVISRIHQEVHAIGPEGGMVSSTVVPQVQAVFPQGALTKKIKVGLQAQPIDPDLTAKLLGRGVAVSPVVTVEPRRRKFHKAITLSIPTPQAHSQGMINQYSGTAPTLRLLCSITGGTTRAQWEDVTGSTPLTFVNECVSFTTTVSARFWLMDCRNIADATKMATELYKEAIHVPFMAKFVVFAKRVDPMEARLRVFCMTDDREDKTLEQQENFTEVAKSRDVEVLENKTQYLELAGNLIPVTKSGDQLQFPFKAFRENRLPFSVRVKDQHADTVGRALFMREPKVAKGEQPQQPICCLNIVLPEDIIPDTSILDGSQEHISTLRNKYPVDEYSRLGNQLRMSDVSNLLGDDWIKIAPEIGITEEEIENIIENYPNSTAQQAQAMLKLFQTKKQNDINILENGLRSIGRDDIVERCLNRTITTTTTTTTVIKRHPKRTSDTNGYEESDLIKDSESLEEINKKRFGRYEHDESKYSAEEKVVDSENEEEAAKRSVAERRERIEKRLSGEVKQPPSVQHKEIVEEIISIKRQSLIEDAVARHEDEILMQKPVDNTYKSSIVPEQVIKLKTTTHDAASIDKDDFERELQDKFQKTLGDVDKFEHKYTHEMIPTTQDFLATEIEQATFENNFPEKTITTVTKTTTFVESIPAEFENGREESPIVKKREVVTTTATTHKITDQGSDLIDADFEQIEREVMDASEVDDILEEARQRADNIQSKVVTKTTVQQQPGETKEIITTTTTIRTIESINLDDVSDVHRQYSDSDEELIQRKMEESVQKVISTPPPTPFEGQPTEDVQKLSDQLNFEKFGLESGDERDSESAKGDDDLLNLIQIEANTLVDTILEESVLIVNNTTPSFNPSSLNQENNDREQHDLSREVSFEENDSFEPHPPSHLSLNNNFNNNINNSITTTNINTNINSNNNLSDHAQISDEISENFAIKSDYDIIVKSPTIESMSGKSFEDDEVNSFITTTNSTVVHDVSLDENKFVSHDNITAATNITPSTSVPSHELDNDGIENSEQFVQIEAQKLVDNVLEESLEIVNTPDESVDVGVTFTDDAIIRNMNEHKLHRVERKFEHLSSEVRDDDPITVEDLVNKEDISMLQTDFSKISWDESLSAATGELGSTSTPDKDLQEVLNIPEPLNRSQLPRPTPRLSKTSTNETNSSMSVDESNSISSAASRTLNKTESEKSEDFNQKKQFWENFDHPIMPAPMPRSRIAKSSQKSKDSFETDSSSVRSSKQISHDDDEERLEDESYPMSDSDTSEQKKSSQIITNLEKIEVCESSETDEDAAAKFYIGESSSNVIRKSASEKRAEFAFENQGYEYSIDSEAHIPAKDYVHENIEIYDDSLLSGDKSHLMVRSTGDEMVLEEKSEFEVSEKLSRQQSEEVDAVPLASNSQPVIHSPIKSKSILETVKPLEEHITIAKASAVEMLKDEIKKPFKLDVISKNTEEEIEKTLEEVEDSLSAVQEELIEVVKDGKLIKQSPSEFEINILPNLKYPASIPEQEELPDTPKKEPLIKIDSSPIKPKQSETEESQQSSNEDSFNKLDVSVQRRKPGQSTTKWSATDTDSESHYQSFESSRPVSSDVENLAPYQSSEYETAQGNSSIVSGSTTLDYHSAVSTLNSGQTISSRDSMKSLDSESSGNLASIEASEATETLVPSTEDIDDGLQSDVISQDLDFDEKEKFTSLESEVTTSDELPAASSAMKRSHEMTFTSQITEISPALKFEEKLGRSVEDLKYGSWEETGRFGSSLEEGSMLSVSISSASNLETMVELNPEQADHLMGSLVGSYDSAKIFTSFTDDATGTTPPEYEHATPTSMTMMTSQINEDDQNNVNTQITTTVDEKIESMRKRGHKRTDSTSVFPGGFVKAGSSGSDSFEDDAIIQEDSDVISSEKDETHGESSDSDYDRFETEYARSFRTPGAPKSKKSEKSKEIDELRFSSPGHSIIETIVEDIHAETEDAAEHKETKKPQQLVDIPNIEVTDEQQKSSTTTVHYAKQVEYKMSEEEYQDLLDKKYKSRLADITKTYDDNIYDEQQPPSPGSDSFEMLNEPDMSDEFVIVEEVAREAHESDAEGKSVSIQSKKYIRKHDEEMEKFIVKSAPEARDPSYNDNFQFDDSPPQDEGTEEPIRGGNGYALEGRKGWVEMNLADPSNVRYPYDVDNRGMLEDIKEEDTDFEVGSSRISSLKDSYSSTPDYDALVKKIHSREHDNLSMNSLQEFESLEQVISLENRKQQPTRSSEESLSNGSYPKRQLAKSLQGDDISLSSLKEFEGLENACMEAHLLEIKAKEEVALLLSRSDESSKSSGSSNSGKPSPKTKSSPPNNITTRTTITTTVVKGQPSQLEQRMAQEFQFLQQKAQEIMEDASISIMEASTDSLEDKKLTYDKTSSQHVSSDSLDKDLKSADPMTTSTDSIEGSKGGEKTGKSSDVDSIEHSSPLKRRTDSIDSIEMLIASQSKGDDLMNFEMSGSGGKKVVTKTTTTIGPSGQQQTITSTVTTRYDMPHQRDISSDSLNARTEPELLLTSSESLSSSTTTNATYRNEMDMSGSTTSCGSNTMIELESAISPFPTDFYSPTSSSAQQFQQTTTTTTTTYSSELLLDDDDFAQFASSIKKSNQ